MLKREVQVTDERKKPLVASHVTFRSSNDFLVTKDDLEKAQRVLNETEERKFKSLKELKDKLSRERGLNCRIDNDFLLRYLRYAKFNCDKAHQAILKIYSLRKQYPEAIALTTRLEHLLDSGCCFYLPYTDNEGRVVICEDTEKWKIDDMSFIEMAQLLTAVWDIISVNPSTQIHGIIWIWNLKELSIRHASKILNPRNIRLFLSGLEDAYPLRLNTHFVINCNFIVQRLYRVIKPFIKKKILTRVKLLGSDLSELHKFVNPVLLPKRYGGSLEDDELSITQHIMDNLPYLRYERSFGYV